VTGRPPPAPPVAAGETAASEQRDRETPVLVSVNVGLPREVAWRGRTVRTGVWKAPVDGPVMARRLNLDGDGQGDLAGHGGEQRAVLVYQVDSYRYWREFFGREDLGWGVFGENLTVDGLADDRVCIGDRYRIGAAEFEVTQPRVTCYRVGLRLGEPQLPALLVAHHRPGFYLRVLAGGRLQAGDAIVKTRTGPQALTVAAADALLYLPGRDLALLRRAVQIPALSPGWRQSFTGLLAAAGDGAGPPSPAWPGFRPLTVTRVVPETGTVSSIYLAAPGGEPLPAARAGQYLTLRLPAAAAGQPALVRSYSLSSAPGAATYRISVRRAPHGTASGWLTTSLRPGATLEVAAPRGTFTLAPGDGPVLLISAGIGLTPVLAMLQQLAAARSPRDIWWIHGARNPAEHALAAETRTLLASLPHARQHVFYSQASPAGRRRAGAAAGRLTGQALLALGVPASADAYLCGPAPFMTAIRGALTKAGLGPGRIHTELFTALPPTTPGLTSPATRPPHPPPGPPGTGPQVTFARSGLSVPFPATTANLLDLADACDVPARWSCRTGVCHTCTTPLLSGDLTYTPDPLEPPADGQVLICCAQPRTDIVLDM
jgi:ferredoxin-NADP reductase/MOSC domain-containing protein YiiM